MATCPRAGRRRVPVTYYNRECAEKVTVIVTINLPFSEWASLIPIARLCKALVDHITDRANMVETCRESYRFRRIRKNAKSKQTKGET